MKINLQASWAFAPASHQRPTDKLWDLEPRCLGSSSDGGPSLSPHALRPLDPTGQRVHAHTPCKRKRGELLGTIFPLRPHNSYGSYQISQSFMNSPT